MLKLIKRIDALVLAVLMVVPGVYLLSLRASAEDISLADQASNLQIVEQTTLLPLASPPYPEVVKTITVIVTGYSSSVSETDSTPFITASGKTVRNGIAANNMLKFGSQIKLPALFGDKIFTVEDRMHSRKGHYHVDIWFESKEEALHFGAQKTEMQILR